VKHLLVMLSLVACGGGTGGTPPECTPSPSQSEAAVLCPVKDGVESLACPATLTAASFPLACTETMSAGNTSYWCCPVGTP